LGTFEIIIGLLTLAGLVSPRVGLVGALLSFLITTPEAWVPSLGDAQHGFPYLSGAGRLALKDVMMLAGAVFVMADSARALLESEQRVTTCRGASRAPLRR
jgi:uncharacterized membrane protein YkgB